MNSVIGVFIVNVEQVFDHRVNDYHEINEYKTFADCFINTHLVPYLANRPRNGYETVDNIKVVSIDSFKQLEIANKVD